ncbi:uncharacterized protein [Rutidosis leptorrhynchoides]|uniref:uncharacterized protein n=1 Tax=Rutidosis leptorrhynchoides TaxID=125765 RepID=UPI003A9A3248
MIAEKFAIALEKLKPARDRPKMYVDLCIRLGKINPSHTHGYLRSCPISLEADKLLKSKVDILCVQETRWRGEEVVHIDDYKLWFSGSRVARNGVGIFIGPRYKDNIVGVGRCSDRIMPVRLVIQEETYMVICAYAPHAGLGEEEKSRF